MGVTTLEGRHREQRWSWKATIGFGLGVGAASVLTVLRYTAAYLQADGVMQALMSVQHVDLFFWGQDRFFSFVPWLMSPIAHPDLNLAACLTMNAIGFYLLLLTLSFMSAPLVTGSRKPMAVATLFAMAALLANLIIQPSFLYVMSLETQPYSWSYCLALWAFLLWRRGGGWRWVLAVVLVGPAVGLNPSSVLLIAALCLADAIARHRWGRWFLLGLVWVVWEGVWVALSHTFGKKDSPFAPGYGNAYFSFSFAQFTDQWLSSVVTQCAAIRLGPLTIVAVASLVMLAFVPWPRLRVLVGVGSWLLVFCCAFWAVFTANVWVGKSGYHARYFFPLFVTLVMGLAAPTAAAIAGPRIPALAQRKQFTQAVIMRLQSACLVGAIALLAVVLGRGPLTRPSRSEVLVATAAPASFAADENIVFVAGNYWTGVPVTLQLLRQGRHAAFYVGLKSGGDPAAYKAAFTEELSKSSAAPRALCVNADLAECIAYLDAWTAPGWVPSAAQCPLPADSVLLAVATPRCQIVTYAPPR